MVGPTVIGGRTSMPARNRRTPRRWPQRSAPLGSHVAALGLAFSAPVMGPKFADGVFVGEHGSWNRRPPAGYKVVFVPFRDGRPAGDPIDFATGFLTKDGEARGRPVGVTLDPRGALIVADDLANTVWRITATSVDVR